jgi:tRNA(Ile2) C34 agmatinyltransferase TiaS
MTTALLESRLSLFGEARRLQPARGRGITLEELLESTLCAAQAREGADCPVCHARMRAEDGAARCSGCGSTLS